MNNKKQELKHYSKKSYNELWQARKACKALSKKGVKVKPYKRGKKYYLTELYRGAKVLSILDSLNNN